MTKETEEIIKFINMNDNDAFEYAKAQFDEYASSLSPRNKPYNQFYDLAFMLINRLEKKAKGKSVIE